MVNDSVNITIRLKGTAGPSSRRPSMWCSNGQVDPMLYDETLDTSKTRM